MAADKITELIDPKVFEQFEKLTKGIDNANTSFLKAIDTAGKYNEALGKSGSLRDLADNQTKAASSIGKLETATAKVRIEEVKLQQARERAFDEYERKLIKQQALADKAAAADAARAAASGKEAARLQALADKRASVIGPTITGGSGENREFTKAEADAIDRKNEALRQERIATADANQATQDNNTVKQQSQAQNQAATAAISNLSAEEQKLQNIINGTSGTLRQNIEQQVGLEAELKQVQAQLKNSSSDTDKASASRVALTQREIELKSAIQQNAVVIKQQVKDQQSTATSAEGLNARLALLRTTYNNLTEAERKNKDVGGVLLTAINDLDKKTKELASSQGVNNKNVGDYENKIKSAIGALVPYGSEIIKVSDSLKKADAEAGKNATSLGRLGAVFGAFSTAAFVAAIGAAKFYLGQFGDTQAKVDTYLSGLKQSFSVLGEVLTGNVKVSSVAEFRKLTLEAKNTGEEISRIKRDFKNYNDVLTVTNDKLRANAEELRAQARDKLLSPETRIALLAKAQVIESQVIENSKENAKKQIDVAINVANAYKRLSKEQIEALEKGDISLANSLKRKGSKGGITSEGYELYKEAIGAQTQVLRDETLRQTRIQNDRDLIQLRSDKKAAAASEDLNKEKLTEQQLAAKSIVDSEDFSYDQRVKALALFVNRSKKLLEISRREQLNAIDPQLTIAGKKDKRDAIELKTQNDINAIRNDAAKTNDKLLESEYNKQIAGAKRADKDLLEILKSGNQSRIAEIISNRDDAVSALIEQFEKGKITEEKYAIDRKNIEYQSSQDIVNIQLEGLKHLVKIKKDAGQDTADDEKTINDLQLKYSKDLEGERINNAKTEADRLKELHALELQLGEEALSAAQNIAQGIFQARLDSIEKEQNAIDEAAKREKDRIDRGIGTSRQKARQQALVDAEAAEQKKKLDEEAAKEKKKAAIAERLGALASIAISTQVAAAKVVGQTGIFGLPLTALIYAQGAIQAAAVLAAPLPEFEKGGTHRGGKLIWGEAGTELAVTPGGRAMLSPNSATIDSMPAGTRIFNNSETMRMMAKPDHVVRVGGRDIDLTQVVGAVRETTAAVKGLVTGGKQRGVVRSGLSNSYLKRNGL